ncbi:MAG TPA: chorismate synthase [Spirochaetaceae bacterium]|nr:chorismate synthase [Spirochaetaceae bacterium]
MNGTGRIFRVSIFGESHGPAIGAVLDGIPPGLPLAAEDFFADLARRRAGTPGTTPRVEDDEPEILSGLFEGHCSGTPLCIVFRNRDTRSSDYERFKRIPRPGHADYTSGLRYKGYGDPRGSGHFSGRVTAGLVAAGVVAKKILPGASFSTRILEAGGSADIEEAIACAAADGDSVGALVELRVRGIEPGLGEPFFEAAESRIAANIYAVPAVRGVEFGDGFAAARMRGSEHNDPFIGLDGSTAKNGAGGINGGITNGNELVIRVAIKPASTIAREQETLNFESGAMERLSGEGRHDSCIALRAMVALEAACAIALADLYLIAKTYTTERERKQSS